MSPSVGPERLVKASARNRQHFEQRAGLGFGLILLKVLVTQSRLFVTPWIVTFPRLLFPWDSPGKNTGLGCQSLLQGIFPTQGLNLVSCIAGRFFTV